MGLDGANAFGSMSRIESLHIILREFPSSFTYMKNAFIRTNQAWFYGLDPITKIEMTEGAQQGARNGTWSYGVGISDFIKGLVDIFGIEGVVNYFVDDGNLSGEFDSMISAIKYILKNGPSVGYNLNLNKGKTTYCLGRTNCPHEALRRKDILISLGLNCDSILIHPLDYNEEIHHNNRNNAEFITYGMKMLGVYVGCTYYIIDNLKKSASELSILANKLILHSNVQERFILFQKSFNNKIIYTLRTTAPRLIEEFIDSFEKNRMRIVASLFGIYNSNTSLNFQTTDKDLWNLLCLPINDGGLGIGNLKDIANCAFAASIADSIEVINSIQSVVDFQTILINTIEQIKKSPHLINTDETANCYINAILNIHSTWSIDNLSIECINALFAPDCSYKKQHNFYQERIIPVKVSAYIESITNNRQRAWHRSITANKGDAGAWLSMIPTMNKFLLSNQQFITAICYRYFIRIPFLVRGLKCSCKQKPRVDEKGHHFVSFCGVDGLRIETHDNVKRALQYCMDHAGWITQLEPKNYYSESNKRADIKAHRPGDIGVATMLFDVMITCPVPAETSMNAVPSLSQANTHHRAANRAYQMKVDKYANETTNVDCEFFPFIMETTGSIHPTSLKLITDLADTGSQLRGIKSDILKVFYLKILSSTLQRSIATSIIQRNASCSSSFVDLCHSELLHDIEVNKSVPIGSF